MATLAREIAGAHGEFTEITASEIFGHPFGLGACIKPGVETVVVREFSGTEEELTLAKVLVSEREVMVERKGKLPELEKLPNFIFCSGSKNPIPVDTADRRFIVIHT